MSKHFVITIATLLIIGIGTIGAIFITKGYTFSSKEGRMVGTGIMSVASMPDGASVYIDGHLTTATNANISSLSPKKYTVRITKEGYIPWEKEVQVFEGLVAEVKATLFPALPTIFPLTFNGAITPVLSPDGQKLAFAVPYNPDIRSRQKGGVWVWTMISAPISFTRGAEPHQLVASTTALDFSKAKLSWSPDSKQVLATMQEGGTLGDASTRSYLLGFDQSTDVPSLRDVTPTIATTLKNWEEDRKVENQAKILAIKDVQIQKIASSSAVVWAPDETKFMVTEGKDMKVYDLSSQATTPAKQITPSGGVGTLTGNKQYILPKALAYFWLPDSKHVILSGEEKISVIELDGANEAVIYAGKFADNFVFPWPDSSKLVVLTSYSTPTASTPNLFGINLK